MQTLIAPATLASLTSAQRDLLPTDEEVALYHERGYYLSRQIFSDDELAAALAGSQRYYRGEYTEPPVPVPEGCRTRPDAGDKLRKNDYSFFFVPELRQLLCNPLLAAIGARLARNPEIRLWHDQLLYKPADKPGISANVGWHTDRGYWKTCTSANMLTAWIPFHDCTAAMGTITMIDGSLHWPDNSEKLNFFMHDLNKLEQEFVTGGRAVRKVPMNISRGCASFHHCLTIHGSGPNLSDQPRRSMAVHMQDAGNQWREYRYKNGNLADHCNDGLCRQVDGHPDYRDPVVCPVLYTEKI